MWNRCHHQQEETQEQKVIAPLVTIYYQSQAYHHQHQDEQAAKIHIIDSIIYSTLASDPAYHTSASTSIQQVYDAFGAIMDDAINVTSKINDYSVIGLIEFMKRASILKSNTLWDLCHEMDPISMCIPSSVPVSHQRHQLLHREACIVPHQWEAS